MSTSPTAALYCAGMVALQLLCTLAAAAHSSSPASPRGGAPCTGPLDCQLNGECLNGSCLCDAAWRGANCSLLNFLPAPLLNGYGRRGSATSSWGGGVVHDKSSNKWVMHVAEIENSCGGGSWETNARCAVAESSTGPIGPYRRVRTLLDAYCWVRSFR